MTKQSGATRVGRALREVTVWAAIILGTLFFLEGAASAYMFVRDRKGSNPPQRLVRPRTLPDTLLGWRNDTSYAKADEYGKGIALHTTADGLRATPTGDSSAGVGIVCSGDSFTFGAGVADHQTWCALLSSALPGVRTFDMGQDLHGLDQTWLWYRRDGARYPHRLQVLAVTNAALERAAAGDDAGWFKPHFELDGDRLAVRNVPVPRQTREALEDAAFERGLDELRIVQAVQRLPGLDPVRRRAERVDAKQPVFEAMLRELAAHHRARGTRLVLAYLPTTQDVRSDRLDARRRWLAEAATRQGLALIDLTPTFRAQRGDSLDLAFVSRTSPIVSPRAAGQYSALGHALVARTLAPELARRLAPDSTAASAPIAARSR
jgi:hypothetical protein